LGNQEFISLYLLLADHVVAGPVNVEFRFSMLDPYMEPLRLPQGRLAAKPARVTFSAPGSSFGYKRFVRSEKLRELLRRDKYGCFAVRVDLILIVEKSRHLH
jgi:hypothetical protein